jgi:hypothetical protein
MANTKYEPRPNTRGSAPSSDKQPSQPSPPVRLRPGWGWLVFIALFVANYFLFSRLVPDQQAPVEVPYSYFKQEVQGG